MKKIVLAILIAATAAMYALPCYSFPNWSGDANGDLSINAKDVTLVMKYLVGSDAQLAPTADYNSDGKINAKDVTLTMKYLVGLPVLTDDLLEAKYGVSEVSFEIPDPVTENEVFGAQFGFDPDAADNSAAFNAAAAYLRDNPGTKLTLEKGVYDLGDQTVSFNGVKNCVIDGGGSTFLYDSARYFYLSGCEGMKFENFSIDWDWDIHYLASIVEVIGYEPLKNDSAKVTFRFLEDDASYALTNNWDSMIHVHPEDLVMSGVQRGDFFNVQGHISDRKLVAPNEMEVVFQYEAPKLGDTLLIRHYNYGPGAFTIVGGSNGIVIEDVKIYGLPGEGIIINDGSHHVRMTRLTIGLNPETAEKHRISTTADAIHIKETHGYYILEDSEIGNCGDDCMNIHDTVGIVSEFYENEVVISAANGSPFLKGDTISFRSGEDFRKIDFTAVITSVTVSGHEWSCTLDRSCEDVLEEGMIVHDDSFDSGHYIVRNCYFHENRARALLAGSSNCLIENNRFYHIQSAAIITGIDISKDVWTEGKGASNVIIRNNLFERCNVYRAGESISFGASSYASKTGSLLGECFTDVLISGNTFVDLPGSAIKAMSVRNLTFYGNKIVFPEKDFHGYSPSKSGQVVILGSHYDDSRIFGNTWVTSSLTPDDFEPWKINPSKISLIYIQHNTVK